MWGKGEESREFIFISDIIRIIELAVYNSTFDGQVVNVANGQQITIAEVAECVKNIIGTDKNIIFNNQVRAGDPKNWEADCSIINSWGYSPTVNLKQGVSEYIKWIKDIK